jgi:cytochrome c oxidase subunit 4
MDADATKAHVKPIKYVGVFVVLAVITAIEFFISSQSAFDPVRNLVIVALVILSIVKATLVMMFFMHLKYDSRWYSLSLVLPLFMAALLAVVVLIASQSA